MRGGNENAEGTVPLIGASWDLGRSP